MSDIEQIRELFQKDRFATICVGAVIDEVSDNCAICSFEIQDSHRNAAGNVMGGTIFSLADFAFAVATNYGGDLTVTVSSTIQFIGGAKEGRLVAKATPDKIGRSVCFYTVIVEDESGHIIAKVAITGKRTAGKVG